MAIISENKRPAYRRYSNTQFRYAMTYVLITLVALVLLNYYSSFISQKLFYQSKETSLIEKCQLAADEIANMDVINTATVSNAVTQLGSLKQTRLLVTDQNGLIIYDNQGLDNRYALFPEILQALECKDVFSWQYRYRDGIMQSRAATPIIMIGTTVGCVYMTEQDPAGGAMIKSMQATVLRISIIMEAVVFLFSVAYSSTFSARLRKIMASMRIIQQGDYSHKVKMSGHDELAFLGDEFNDLTERLQTSEEKRSRFVSDASHELKTPLASIKLLTDSILQNNMDANTMREFVEDIGNEADRLNRTTEKLLSLTRIDGQNIDVAEITNMVPTVERVVRMLSGLAQKSEIDIRLNIQEDCPILISEDDLYQIIFNLIENGIKYNLRGGTLSVTLTRRDDNGILEVADTGVGIPEESVSHIFERFYRVDKARSRATGGSGLGLSIVLAIVRRNRGDIKVVSELNKGTTFTVCFPAFDTEEANQ